MWKEYVCTHVMAKYIRTRKRFPKKGKNKITIRKNKLKLIYICNRSEMTLGYHSVLLIGHYYFFSGHGLIMVVMIFHNNPFLLF